jgi:cytochrome P450
MDVADAPVLPGAKPFFGHLWEVREDRLAFTKRIAREVDRASRFVSPVATALIVNHPELLQEVLVEKARIFDKSAMIRFSLYPLAGEGLFTSRYDLWKNQRKLMAPLFHASQLASYARDMVACTKRVLSTWSARGSLELARETTRITMSIAGKALFDADTLDEADELGWALTTALDWTNKNAPSPFAIAHILGNRLLNRAAERWSWESLRPIAKRLEGPLFLPGADGRRLKEAIAILDGKVQRMIDARRRDPSRQDLLAKLLSAHDESNGRRMTDKQVRDEILTLFVAGHETTATALAWAVHCLCKNPALYAAAEREADACAGDPTVDDLPRLSLTLRIFKETLRLYPPVYAFGRQAMSATSIDGYEIPRFTVAMISPWALHRRPDIWPQPEVFDPDRFLPEREAQRHKLSWLPFGAGPRICIGNHFALMEGQLVLATMLRHARFEPIGEEEPDCSATLRPKFGMKMRVRARSHSPASDSIQE